MRAPILVDALGEACPIPVIELAKAAETAGPGDEIEVLTDDPAAEIDIPAWCAIKGAELIRVEDRARGWAYLVRL